MRLLLFFLLAPLLLSAQELSLEEDVAITIKEYQTKDLAASKRKDWAEATKWRRLVYETVTNSTVKPVNLEDQHGELWNLGVLDQPFVVHGISNWRSGLNELKIAAANVVADEYATKLMTFLLMPEPVTAIDSQRLASISKNIIVVFMEMTQVKDRKADDTRLLSLVNGFPVTYYIRANREIAGVKFGLLAPRPKEKNIAEVTEEKAHATNVKRLQKDIRALLRGKKIKNR